MLFSAANIAVARSYLSAATKLSERTHAVSMVSLAQVIFSSYFLQNIQYINKKSVDFYSYLVIFSYIYS